MKTWKCDICGDIHQGETAPVNYALCGADSDHFSPLEGTSKQIKSPSGNRWRCSICDDIHIGPSPPAQCSVCSAGPNMFEAVAEEVIVYGNPKIKNIPILANGSHPFDHRCQGRP